MRCDSEDRQAVPGDIVVPIVPDRLLPAFVSSPTIAHQAVDRFLDTPTGTVMFVIAVRKKDECTGRVAWRDTVCVLVGGRLCWTYADRTVPLRTTGSR